MKEDERRRGRGETMYSLLLFEALGLPSLCTIQEPTSLPACLPACLPSCLSTFLSVCLFDSQLATCTYYNRESSTIFLHFSTVEREISQVLRIIENFVNLNSFTFLFSEMRWLSFFRIARNWVVRSGSRPNILVRATVAHKDMALQWPPIQYKSFVSLSCCLQENLNLRFKVSTVFHCSVQYPLSYSIRYPSSLSQL